MNTVNNLTSEFTSKNEANYLLISIPYDKEDRFGLFTFDNGIVSELERTDGYVPPLFNNETKTLEVTIDLIKQKVIDWKKENGFIHMWAKVCDTGTYTLLDANKKPLYQIKGYVPIALIPPYEEGYGDYLELTIETDGSLPQWKSQIDISDFT